MLRPRREQRNATSQTLLLTQLSATSVLSPGSRWCGRIPTSHRSICLTQVRMETGSFSPAMCTFLTLQNRKRNQKVQLQGGLRANFCLAATVRSPASETHRARSTCSKTSCSWEKCQWQQSLGQHCRGKTAAKADLCQGKSCRHLCAAGCC